MNGSMRFTKILLVIITAIVITQCGQNYFYAQSKEVMVNSQGKVSDSMLQLLALTGVEHDGSLASIVKETQAQWLRKPGQERWDIVEQDYKQRDEINKLLKKMGFINEIKPILVKHDKIPTTSLCFSKDNDNLYILSRGDIHVYKILSSEYIIQTKKYVQEVPELIQDVSNVISDYLY